MADQRAWMLKNHLARLDEFPAHPLLVRLLAGFDTYLLGYKNRNITVAPRYARRINAGGGMIRPTLLVNGQALGTWKSMQRKKHLAIMVEPFEQLSSDIQQELEVEAVDMARFLRIPAAIVTTPN